MREAALQEGPVTRVGKALEALTKTLLELVKRGKSPDGKQFLNYQAAFNDLTWQETLELWLKKHA